MFAADLLLQKRPLCERLATGEEKKSRAGVLRELREWVCQGASPRLGGWESGRRYALSALCIVDAESEQRVLHEDDDFVPAILEKNGWFGGSECGGGIGYRSGITVRCDLAAAFLPLR